MAAVRTERRRDGVCPVCQYALDAGDVMEEDAEEGGAGGLLTDGELAPVSTTCEHDFHVACLDKWLSHNYEAPTCPVCRTRQFKPAL